MGRRRCAGTKIFSSSPNVPQPTSAGDIATKGYVDQTVTTVGAGSYLSTAGGTMTGPITLPANALSTMDAVSSREIVDADKFRQGISLVIDGTVQCLNASTWAKKGSVAAN